MTTGARLASLSGLSGVSAAAHLLAIRISGATAGAMLVSRSTLDSASALEHLLNDGRVEEGDTHDGYWHKQWARLHKKKPKLEDIIELVQERPAIALAEVKEAVKRQYPTVDYLEIAKNVTLQRFIAQQILITLELRRIAEDEDDIETLLML